MENNHLRERIDLEGATAVDAVTPSGNPFAVDRSEPEPLEPTYPEVISAYWRNETLVGAVNEHLEFVDKASKGQDPYFNALRFYGANKEEYADLEDVILSGAADNLRSPEAFKAFAERVRQERTDRDTMGRGTIMQNVAGTAVSFLDLTTLIPQARLGTVVGKSVLKGATSAMAITAVQEGGLQALQQERTAAESILNIGTAGVLGGATFGTLGYLAANRASRVDVAHAMDLANEIEQHTLVPGMPSASEARNLETSINAAKTDVEEVEWTASGPLMKGLDWLSDKLGPLGRTPSVVAAKTRSNEARRLFQNFADLGLTSKQNKSGVAQPEAAEDLLHHYERWGAVANDEHQRAWRKAEVEAGGSTTALDTRGSIGQSRILPHDFNREVYKMLVNPEYQPEVPWAKHAADAAEGWRKFYDDFYQEGVQRGMFQKEKRIGDYIPQLFSRSAVSRNPHRLKQILTEIVQTDFNDDWLQTNLGMTREKFDGLAPAEQQKIRDQWNAENDVYNLEKAEARVSELEEQLEVAQAEFISSSNKARGVKTREVTARVRAAEAEGQEYETRINEAKTRQKALSSDQAVFLKAADALERANVVRKMAEIEKVSVTDTTYQKWLDRLNAAEKLSDFLMDVDKRLGASNQVHGESKLVRYSSFDTAKMERLAKRFDDLDKTFQKQMNRQLVAPADPRLKADLNDPRTNFLRGIAKEAGDNAEKWNKHWKQMEARRDRLWAKRYELEDLRVKLKDAKKDLLDNYKDAKKLRNELRRELKAAKKDAKNARSNSVSTSEYVDQLVAALQNRGEFPHGLLYDGFVGKSSRQKFRKLHIPFEYYDQLIDEGYLQFDPRNIGMSYARDVGGRLALREKFGTEEINEILKPVEDDFGKMLSSVTDPKELQRLQVEQERVREAALLMRDRILGTHDFGGADGSEVVMWASRMARNANFLRYMGSTVLSAIQDLATISLTTGVGKTLPKAFGKNVERIASKIDDKELAVVLLAVENNPMLNRMTKTYDLDELLNERGIGTGAARKITASMEGATLWLSDQMNTLNLMRFWNGRMKFASGMNVMHNILKAGEKVAKGAELTEKELRDMALLTLNETHLKRFYEMTQKHGEQLVEGVQFPRISEWHKDKEGAALARRLYTALDRALNKAVITPGIADTPPFMSNWFGKLMLQFQTFAFASVNKWARHLDYAMMNGQTMEALASTAWALAAGTASFVLREGVVKNRWDSVRETLENPVALGREMLDRGGFMFMLNPYVNSSLKLGEAYGLPVEKIGMMPSRYRQSHWLSGFLGPSFQLFKDIEALPVAEADKVGQKLKRLAPFGNLFYLDAILRRAGG